MENCRLYVPVILLLGVVGAGHADDLRADELDVPATQEVEIDGLAPGRGARDPDAFVEANGLNSMPPFFASDVVVVIDHSTLALVASGLDVDQDGVVGRNRREMKDRRGLLMPAQFWTTDAGDTVHELQIKVARAVVSRLAARQNNVGLTSFTLRSTRSGTGLSRLHDRPEVIVPVGAADSVLEALDSFPAPQERRRTDLGRLLERAAQLLDVAALQHQERRPRAILLLFLGEPSAPDGVHWSSKQALGRAEHLGERGIAVWAIPIRSVAGDYLDELTRRSGGQVIPLDQLDTRFGAL